MTWSGAFQESALESVRLPSTLKRIEYRTFMGCRNLKTVELPDGLEYIGEECFYKSWLESIRIPPALKTIETRTFYDCKNLSRVEFSEGLEHLGELCFWQTGLESVDFPASLRTISQGSFSECKNLKSARFAEGLEVLGTYESQRDIIMWNGAFQKSALESVILPSTLKRIAYRTFTGCKNLTAVELPDGLEYLGKDCFYESGLESINIPPALKTIEA